MAARLEWVKAHETWIILDWMKIIWFDESSIQIEFDSRQTVVFRRKDEEYNSECLCPSFKSKGVNIMIWGCFARNRLDSLMFWELKGIEAEEYIEILLEGLLSFVDDFLGVEDEDTIHVKWSGDLIFMQDDALCHKTLDIMHFLDEFDLQVMIWPAQSPDLNLIENLWHILKVKFHQRYTDLHCSLSKSQKAIYNYDDILRQVWSELDFTAVSNLIRSMLERVQAVIAVRGGVICYWYG